MSVSKLSYGLYVVQDSTNTIFEVYFLHQMLKFQMWYYVWYLLLESQSNYIKIVLLIKEKLCSSIHLNSESTCFMQETFALCKLDVC